MADFTIIDATTGNELFAEAPDDADEMKIYIDGGHTVYLRADDRRRLIDFLIRHTEEPERATMTIMVSPELVKQLTDWSQPVQIKIIEARSDTSATHEMVIRPVSDKSNYGAPGMPDGAPERAREIAESMPTVGQWPGAHNAAYGVPVCYCDGAGRHVHGSNCPPLAVSEDEAQRSEVPDGAARKLIGPPYAHLDAPCTDACYEAGQ